MGAFSPFPGHSAGQAWFFEEVTLVDRIGPEAVALLIDPEPEELPAREAVTFNLKAGIAATDYGPVLFLIWWVPPFIDGRRSAFYEQTMNPLHANVSEILRRLAGQTHLHVGPDGKDGGKSCPFSSTRTGSALRESGRELTERGSPGPVGRISRESRRPTSSSRLDEMLAGRYD